MNPLEWLPEQLWLHRKDVEDPDCGDIILELKCEPLPEVLSALLDPRFDAMVEEYRVKGQKEDS